MEGVKDILKSVLSDLQKKQKETDFGTVVKAWKKIVGPQAFPHTKIVYLTKELIRVNVDNSSSLYDLSLKKEGIRRALKKTLKIEDVRFKLGDI